MVLLLQNLPVAVAVAVAVATSARSRLRWLGRSSAAQSRSIIRETFCNELKHSCYDDENSQE
jgi:hypothetical protein